MAYPTSVDLNVANNKIHFKPITQMRFAVSRRNDIQKISFRKKGIFMGNLECIK